MMVTDYFDENRSCENTVKFPLKLFNYFEQYNFNALMIMGAMYRSCVLLLGKILFIRTFGSSLCKDVL